MRRSHHNHAGGLIDSVEDPPALSIPAGISQTTTFAQQQGASSMLIPSLDSALQFTFVINSGHNLRAK